MSACPDFFSHIKGCWRLFSLGSYYVYVMRAATDLSLEALHDKTSSKVLIPQPRRQKGFFFSRFFKGASFPTSSLDNNVLQAATRFSGMRGQSDRSPADIRATEMMHDGSGSRSICPFVGNLYSFRTCQT